MAEALKTIFDILGRETPLWLFGLAVILYFLTGPVRQMINDKREREDLKSDAENTRKETIAALVDSAKQADVQIQGTEANIRTEADRVNEFGIADHSPPQAAYIDELVESLDGPLSRLRHLMKQAEAIDIYDGSHDNLLQAKNLLNEVNQVKMLVDNVRIGIFNTVHALERGRI